MLVCHANRFENYLFQRNYFIVLFKKASSRWLLKG